MLPLALGLAGCNPASSGLERLIERNPQILLNAIEKNPEAFMRTFERAAQVARSREDERLNKEEMARREAEFIDPLRPILSADRAFEGNERAPITIVEYSDFQCPYCKAGVGTIADVLERYPGQVRVILKHKTNPDIHPFAPVAARYYEAIALQSTSKAVDFKHRVFAAQQQLSVDGERMLRSHAAAAGADMSRIDRDLKESSVIRERIAADSLEAAKFGFEGTPAYVVNGVSIRGAYPLDDFVKLIDRQLGLKVGGKP